jgi:hypothetical protein
MSLRSARAFGRRPRRRCRRFPRAAGVIQAMLANDFGLDVTFHETTPIYVERPTGTGEAIEILHA